MFGDGRQLVAAGGGWDRARRELAGGAVRAFIGGDAGGGGEGEAQTEGQGEGERREAEESKRPPLLPVRAAAAVVLLLMGDAPRPGPGHIPFVPPNSVRRSWEER